MRRYLYYVSEDCSPHGDQEYCLFTCHAEDVASANRLFFKEIKTEPFSIPNLRIVPVEPRRISGKPKRPQSRELLRGDTGLAKAVRWFTAQILFSCFYCGVELLQTRPPNGQRHPPNGYTRDHVIPKSKGGKVKVPCCVWCNSKKGSRDADAARKLLTGRRDGKFYGEQMYAEYIRQASFKVSLGARTEALRPRLAGDRHWRLGCF